MTVLIVVLLFGFAVAVLVAVYFYDERNIYRDRFTFQFQARERIQQARIADNDLRAVDNERWAERVCQAREHTLREVGHYDPAGVNGESPVEHIRNALGILMNAPNLGHSEAAFNLPGFHFSGVPKLDFPLVCLEQADYVAVKNRLRTAEEILLAVPMMGWPKT